MNEYSLYKNLKIALLLAVLFGFNSNLIAQKTKQTRRKKICYTEILWINAKKEVCNSNKNSKKWYLVKHETTQQNWELLSKEIKGFQYVEGFEYKIKVY